ncbi:THUMP domain-containing class I SAM-dependent RNA methyltransferase [Natranaerobius thermophilus]|uniref:Putative RNA methylase n=1 Tax=Natranaerobius thermophilus (strain ATCC BAA-1301 / DSM 18059 / JW/NM-WN-LF) TaxID=457570 RepID=B2A4W3_NATTJ|nr:class I SAM-dependent RNA methyltransferase [Natranaerobius thermophilus]ACB83885.1 putative RNA methylase [Natranaerobius thermophilus JW/NM-WN-LF]
MSQFELIATSTFGLEALVKQEIKDLGYEIVSVENGKVTFKGDEKAICRANLWLRTADRVKLKIGEFTAKSFEELFEQTYQLPWEELLPQNAEFPVEGKSVKSQLYSVPNCQSIVKKAVVKKMGQAYGQSWFEEDGPFYKIEVALLKDIATLTIDTSGPGLHKRGYRALVSHAPLKETLAAALIMLARWYPDTALIDPLCGSGTIPIEAAMIGRNIPPGLNRNFSASSWPIISDKIWQNVREEGQDKAEFDKELKIYGSDFDEEMVQLSQDNAEKVLGKNIPEFTCMPIDKISSNEEYGKLICNPPYGERLGEEPEVDDLYRQMGQIFNKRFPTWSYYILTPHNNFEKLFGKKASKKRKLYNGRIRVDYYQYFGPKPPNL